jgi:hypothetical protein
VCLTAFIDAYNPVIDDDACSWKVPCSIKYPLPGRCPSFNSGYLPLCSGYWIHRPGHPYRTSSGLLGFKHWYQLQQVAFFFFGQVALNNSSRLSSTWLFWTQSRSKNIDQNQDSHSGPFVPKVGSPITTTIYGHCNSFCYLLRPCWSAELLKACLALILQPRSPTQHHLKEWPFWNPICKADNCFMQLSSIKNSRIIIKRPLPLVICSNLIWCSEQFSGDDNFSYACRHLLPCNLFVF